MENCIADTMTNAVGSSEGTGFSTYNAVKNESATDATALRSSERSRVT